MSHLKSILAKSFIVNRVPLIGRIMVTKRRKKVSFWKTVKVPKRVKVTFYVSSKRKKKKRS